jgi:hypothetical protein
MIAANEMIAASEMIAANEMIAAMWSTTHQHAA